MKRIYKYKLANRPRQQTLELPFGANVIEVEVQEVPMQGQQIFIWAIIDTQAKTEKRVFERVLTGQDIDDSGSNLLHHGTVHVGGLVFHIIEHVNLHPVKIDT